MENREELIKAFFSDEEKVRAVAKDEDFLNKVSGGEATPETYKEEFKKLGLDLTDEEAAQTAEMVNKIHSTPDEKLPEVLNDLSLESVSGGGNQNDNAAIDYTHTHASPTGAEIAAWGGFRCCGCGGYNCFRWRNV